MMRLAQFHILKGQLFLIYLEQQFGRDVFDVFVKEYFNTYAFKSLATAEFVEYLDKNLLSKHPGIVSLDKAKEWIYQPGLPADAPTPTSDAFDKVDTQISLWTKGEITANALPTENWTVHEWLYFINNLPRDLAVEK
eukprot:TRINITY_DN29567_c0_g1_i1.p1 TRINITY_DN29567_c0_g1~~TRINITY_DN29567_c0_g1_i1.p1  ORF type:complete len:137 (-),score=25.02 TRINITY_DN29567_c0_g1_i1:31-441(-)